MSELSKESLVFATELNKWRNAHNLSGSDLAKLLGISKQMVSDVLSGRRAFSADMAFKAIDTLNKFQNTIPMNDQNELEALEQVNQAVIRRHLGKANIKYFQTLGNDGSGWVPGLSGVDPVNSGSIADILQTIASAGNSDDVAAQLRALVIALKRLAQQDIEATVKAAVNRNSVTRPPLRVRGSGERATVIDDGQCFSSNETGGHVLNFSTDHSYLAHETYVPLAECGGRDFSSCCARSSASVLPPSPPQLARTKRTGQELRIAFAVWRSQQHTMV